jgi:low temperature requirement protein LtrA
MSTGESQRVTTLELFFDLVFVFTLTQLTAVLYHARDSKGLVQAVVMLVVIWWMYGGYAWLTNAVSIETAARRLLLLAGMGAYFVLALAVPRAFAGAGLAFGVAYTVIVLVHTALFTQAAASSAAKAILALAPYNLAVALAILVGGLLGGRLQYALWAGAGLFAWLTPLVRGNQGFLIAPAHFVERHGLVVIIAIGESIVAIGVGASRLAVSWSLVAVAGVGLALSAGLWWLYFGGDDERAEEALVGLPVSERGQAALRGFGYWHLPMLFGIIAIAAVERHATADPFSPLNWTHAATLGGGVALFLGGDVAFRRQLGIGALTPRTVAVGFVLAAIPVGRVSPFAESVLLVVLLAALAAGEAMIGRRAAVRLRPL